MTLAYLLWSESRNDPRLLRDSPELLAISNWLQTSTGKIVGYSFGSIHGGVAAAVAVAGYTETAVKILATGDGCLGVLFAIFFWYIGKFLLGAIERSLAHNTGGEEGSGDRRDPVLLAARKKVVKIISFFVQQCVMASMLLLFSAHSKYGTEAPLLLFCAPFTMPLAWNVVCTQLFTGRSRTQGLSVRSQTSGGVPRLTAPTDLAKHTVKYTRHNRVVPTEASVAPC